MAEMLHFITYTKDIFTTNSFVDFGKNKTFDIIRDDCPLLMGILTTMACAFERNKNNLKA